MKTILNWLGEKVVFKTRLGLFVWVGIVAILAGFTNALISYLNQ